MYSQTNTLYKVTTVWSYLQKKIYGIFHSLFYCTVKLIWIFSVVFFRRDNHNRTITSDNTKYHINHSLTDTFIKINDVTVEDRGYYTLIARNNYGQEESLPLFLDVSGKQRQWRTQVLVFYVWNFVVCLDKPNVHLKTEDFYLFDQINIVKCVVAAFPPPDIVWEFKSGDNGNFETVRPYWSLKICSKHHYVFCRFPKITLNR